MKKVLFVLLTTTSMLAQSSAGGNLTIGGGITAKAISALPVISGLTLASSANTVTATWSTSAGSDTQMNCGTTLGTYTIASPDNGWQTSTISHLASCANLSPSTTYFVQVTSTNVAGTATDTANTATIAVPATTAIASLTVGSITTYNSINPSNQGNADSYWNTCLSGPTCFFLNEDANGFQVSGVPATNCSAVTMGKFLTLSPLVMQTANFFTAYGPCGTPTGDDGLSAKSGGIFAMNSALFMVINRQQDGGTSPAQVGLYSPQTKGQIIASYDQGAHWNNFQNPGGSATSYPTTPFSAAMWSWTSPSNFASSNFIMNCADDGTLGTLSTCNQHDDSNVFVYMVANEGCWNGSGAGSGCSSNYYLMRWPRTKLANLNPADAQCLTAADGSVASHWGACTSATPILTEAGHLGWASVQWLPAKNRYLMMTFYYPSGNPPSTPSTTENSVWSGYEAQYPWGPWTKIYTGTWTGTGYYNPIILNPTAYAGTSLTVMATGDYQSGASTDYELYLFPVTVN